MLIVRSPLRISLAGGGTDLPVYYREYGGAVINTSIDRYFYVVLKTQSSNGLEIASADYRTFFRHDGNCPLSWEGELELPRAIFHHFGIYKGMSLFRFRDPTRHGPGIIQHCCCRFNKGLKRYLRIKFEQGRNCRVGLRH